MHKNHKGFALIEGLLIILILVILGFAGYYVWHTQKQTDKTNANTLKASQSTAISKSSSPTSQKTLIIKEWGVKAAYNSNVSLTYLLRDSDNNVAETSSQELSTAGCPKGGGLIARYTSNQIAKEPGANGTTASAFAQTLNKDEYGHVGDYYYFFEHSQSGCGDSGSSIIQTQQETNDAAKSLLPNLQTSS